MKMQYYQTKATIKSELKSVCNHCGHSVALGSGRFINRVPDLNDFATRIESRRPFPFGDFVCDICDNNSNT